MNFENASDINSKKEKCPELQLVNILVFDLFDQIHLIPRHNPVKIQSQILIIQRVFIDFSFLILMKMEILFLNLQPSMPKEVLAEPAGEKEEEPDQEVLDVAVEGEHHYR